jgi:hypothetical protein
MGVMVEIGERIGVGVGAGTQAVKRNRNNIAHRNLMTPLYLFTGRKPYGDDAKSLPTHHQRRKALFPNS